MYVYKNKMTAENKMTAHECDIAESQKNLAELLKSSGGFAAYNSTHAPFTV